MSVPIKRPETRANRWNLRVSDADDATVRAAAEAAGAGVSGFVREAALAEAERVLADRTRFTLDDTQWNRLAERLDRPPQVPAGLKRLFARPTAFE